MNVNLEYYRIFYYVAKYGNFTKAARALNNSQPNITRAMNCLEHEVNCTLFVRTNRGVYLTPEGERLYTRVSAAMKQFQLAEEELSDSAGLEYGNVSIGATETALNIYLLDRLKNFHMSYPGVKIKITNHSTPQAIRSLRSGEIDFAVVTTPLEMDGSMNEVELSEFREMLVGGRSFAELENRSLSLKDLKDYPFISLGADTATYHFYDQLFFILWSRAGCGHRSGNDGSDLISGQKRTWTGIPPGEYGGGCNPKAGDCSDSIAGAASETFCKYGL